MDKKIRISQRRLDALKELADSRGIHGQRGTWLQALIHEIADTAYYALSETVAAHEIASACASGEDWSELIEIVKPKHDESQGELS